MSTEQPNKTIATITDITNQVSTYAPIAIAGVLAAEAASQTVPLTGANKQAAVVSTIMAGIQAGAQAGERSKDVTVSGLSALIDMIVSIFNITGAFKHS